MSSSRAGPWFTDFWVGEFTELTSSTLYVPMWAPKLLMVTDPRQSKFARDLASKIDHADAHFRVPTLYLSSHENEAWQDALGAVQGMR